MKKYWYYITEIYCPQCGGYKIYRGREYTRKPKNYDKRHDYVEAWDGCGV